MRERRPLLGRNFARRWNRHIRRVDTDRRRVLLEEADVADAFGYWCLLSDSGFDVSWCPGPLGPPPRRCPLVESRRCALVEEADVVVTSLGLHREPSRDVVAAIRSVYPEKPVIVQAPLQLLEKWAPLLGGCRVCTRMPMTGRTLVTTVELALGEGGDAPDG